MVIYSRDVATLPSTVQWNRWNSFLLLTASAHFALVYTVNTSPFLDLNAFAAGHERSPFQYRALTAWIFWLGNHLFYLPARFALYLPARLRSVNSFVLFAFVFVSLVSATYVTRRSLEALTGDTVTSRWWALLVVFMSYFHYLLDFGHPCCTPFQLPYDLPSMMLFAVCLYLIIVDRMSLFYICFLIASLNKESSLLIILIFLLYRSVGTHSVRSAGLFRLTQHVLYLSLVWLATRVFLHHIYTPPVISGPHIGSLSIYVFDNLIYLARPYYWASYASIFGFTWLFIYSHALEIPSPGIRRALLVAPVCLACLYVAGVLLEIRIFGELISLHVIALALLLQKLLRPGNSHQDIQQPSGWTCDPSTATYK